VSVAEGLRGMFEKEDYLINKHLSEEDLRYHPDAEGRSFHLDRDLMLRAAVKANTDFETQINQFERWRREGVVVLWDGILHKNRSGAVGECLGMAYCVLAGSTIAKNPHEAGSPDFFPLLESTQTYLDSPVSDSYKGGGFDAKGCKISDMKFMSVVASSHHRQTNTVLVVAWNYFGGFPKILSAFFANNLTAEDWKIGSVPKNDNSKPTSSASLLKSGMDKIRMGWMFVHKSVALPHGQENIKRYRLDAFSAFASERDSTSAESLSPRRPPATP
jgi:hypothetical protein